MRRVRYHVAASLDGYIAGPKGEYDWITHDPTIDFDAMFAQFDTFVMGRKTFEIIPPEQQRTKKGERTFVFSKTLKQADYPDVTIVSDRFAETVDALRKEDRKKDIWLFGGGELFRTLLEAGVVDTVEIAIIPVLLGGGIPMLPSPAPRAQLAFREHKIYPSGIVMLSYDVKRLRTTSRPRAAP
jgi:dihydrofolate reductase